MSDTPKTDELAKREFVADGVWIRHAREIERENAKLREALEISDDYINQMLHGDIELTHGQLEAWRKLIYRLRTKEAQP